MSNERDQRVFRSVYSGLLKDHPEPPSLGELSAGLQMSHRSRPPLTLLAAAVLAATVALLALQPWSTPPALAILEEARIAFTSAPPFHAALTGRIDGEIVGAELGADARVPDYVFSDRLWFQGSSGWRREVVDDPLPELRGGAGSVSVWDGSQLVVYRAYESTYSIHTDPNAVASPLRELDPQLQRWPLLTGGSLPSDAYFTERCRVGPDQSVARRPSRHLSCEEGRVEIWLDAETGLVLKVDAPFGGHEVTSIEYAANFPPAIFAFEPPPDARTAEASEDPYDFIGLLPGQTAPEWEARLVGGGQIRLADLKGSPAVVLVWADWCPPCLESLGRLQQASDLLGREAGFVAVAVLGSTDQGAHSVVQDRGFTVPVAVGNELGDRWEVEAVPLWVVLDGEGRVLEVAFDDGVDLDQLAWLLSTYD